MNICRICRKLPAGFFALSTTFWFLLINFALWLGIIRGLNSYAWDGSAHNAISQIYCTSAFPTTFNWSNTYFGGMPFPNFYPPLFYWLVSLFSKVPLFTFPTAFKIVVCAPIIILPALFWRVAWSASERNHFVAFSVGLACTPLLADARFAMPSPAGLDYFSTFQIGLYTQPLGFALLLMWLVSYWQSTISHRRAALSAMLLALTLLANFFSAASAGFFVVTTLGVDLWHICRAHDAAARRALSTHLAVPLVAAALSAFWLVPMLNQYAYFVTRPLSFDSSNLFTPALVGWHIVALIGARLWLQRHTPAAIPYLAGCLLLAFLALGAETFAPSWFPLQGPRFLAMLNFLLAVPVGFTLDGAFRGLSRLLGETTPKHPELNWRRVRYTTGVFVVALLVFFLSSPGAHWAYAFYPAKEPREIDGVLEFGQTHRDGRFLVEVINPKLSPAYTAAAFDARALNAYLGVQGNETLSTVFHEASPNSLFMLPAINALSDYPDSFGISSALTDDLDFNQQPIARHLERARFLGAKYLAVRTPQMKEKLAKEPLINARYDLGWWSVFELRGTPPPPAQVLPYRPALFVSPFTVKERRRNDLNFIRLAEEQFADGWFDVLLARAPTTNIDRLADLKNFGAIILDTYDFFDEETAYARLRDFAQTRPLILLTSDAPFCQRLRSNASDFPQLSIIERPAATDPDAVLDAMHPRFHYNGTLIRQHWQAIRQILNHNKITVNAPGVAIQHYNVPNAIELQVSTPPEINNVPILLNTTFHPNWTRTDNGSVYAATPFYMLTFADKNITINYGRTQLEQTAFWFSSVSLMLLLGSMMISGRKENTKSALG
jgi:hypothetical protein